MPIRKHGAIAVLALASLAACGSKTPVEIEAEKRKADEAWAAQVAAAERARQADEERLVQQEVAAHRNRTRAEEESAAQAERAQEERERDRLLEVVRSNLPAPQAARFANLRWNGARSALCGEVSVDADAAEAAASRRFVASGERALVDSDEAQSHAAYGAYETANDCSP